MAYTIKVVESREFLVTYEVDAETVEDACETQLAYSDDATEIDRSQLDDSEEQLFIDSIQDDEGNVLPVPVEDTQAAYQLQSDPWTFDFRIWTFANDSYEDPLLEVWVNGFETIEPGKQPLTEWALHALTHVPPVKAFDLDITKLWQIVGKAKLIEAVQSPHNLEPAEDKLQILSFEKREVPLTYHYPESETS